MNKRKILALAMALSMVAILAMGATLAYFTDTKTADNIFTVGDVSIWLYEQERVPQTTDGSLQQFTGGKHLYPIVGSAQGEKDALLLPTAENYVDKIVTIENTGSEPAWVRAYFAIPSALDDGYDTFNAGANILHFNFGNNVATGETTYQNEWIWKNNGTDWNYFETTMAGIKYNVYFADYATTLIGGDTTVRLIDGVYLDSTVDFAPNGDLYAFDAKQDLDTGWNWDAVNCPVYAVAVQAAGFDTAAAAVEAAFGAEYNPWGTTVSYWH